MKLLIFGYVTKDSRITVHTFIENRKITTTIRDSNDVLIDTKTTTPEPRPVSLHHEDIYNHYHQYVNSINRTLIKAGAHDDELIITKYFLADLSYQLLSDR